MWRALRCGGLLATLALVGLGLGCDDAYRPIQLGAIGGGNSSGGGGLGGSSFGGSISISPGGFTADVGGKPSQLSQCANIIARSPLTRWSVADIDGTLELWFGPGPKLAATFSDATLYDRALSPDFFDALRTVARERAANAVADDAAFEICGDATDEPSCIEPWLGDWGAKLYRRPLSAEQVDAYVAQFRSLRREQSAAEAAKNALVSMILSPYFVMRLELGEGNGQQLSGYEVASRLSHFATRSAPDAELSAAAASGALLDPATLRVQLQRLWQSPAGKAARELQQLEALGIRPEQTPAGLDADVYTDMLTQARLLIRDVFEEQSAELGDLFTSPRHQLNARLATHYGTEPPAAEGFSLANVDPDLFSGILATGAFLSTFPRPTLRGKQIAEAVLCRPPPPPPALQGQVLGAGATPRERITAATSKSPVCTTCHATFDPSGFALEAFDAQGRLTGFDSSGAITPDIEFTAVPLADPRELGAALAASYSARRCAAHHFIEAALDRRIVETTIVTTIRVPPGAPLPNTPPQSADLAWVECLLNQVGNAGFNLRAAAEAIADSYLFLLRSGVPRRVVAFDTSPDPVEHALQEMSQFRGVFPDTTDGVTVQVFIDSLRTLAEHDAAPDPAGGAGAGGASAP